MRLSCLFEEKGLKLPSNFNGTVYKWIDANESQDGQMKIPGYVTINRWPNHSFKVGNEYQMDIRDIIHDILMTQPREPYHEDNDGYYSHKTNIKPGWACPEFSENGVAEVFVITVPRKLILIRISEMET